MNLELLKNTYAQEQGYEDWDNYVIKHFVSSKYSMTATLSVFENHMDKICIRAQKAALEKAAEYFDMHWNKSSITNPENLIL